MLGNFNMKFDDNTLSNDNVDEDEFLKMSPKMCQILIN